MKSEKYQEDFSHIREMMERSSQFSALSGLSGVFAWLVALCGATYIGWVLHAATGNFFD